MKTGGNMPSLTPTQTYFSAFKLLPAWEQGICGATARPIVDKHYAYVQCEHNYLFGFAPEASDTQQYLWRLEPGGELATIPEPLNDGVLVSTTHNEVLAVDGLTGQIRWRYSPKEKYTRVKGWLICHPYSVKYVPPLVHVLYMSGISTLNASDGADRHFHSAWREWHYLEADQSRIYVCSKEEGVIESITPGYPWPTWVYECGSLVNIAPLVDGEMVYCASLDARIHLLAKESGELVMLLKLTDRLMETPVIANGILYVVTTAGDLRALDVAKTLRTRSSNEVNLMSDEDWLWTFRAHNARFLWSPIVFEDAIFIAGDNGYIYGLDAISGQLIWQNNLGVSGRLGLAGLNEILIAVGPGKVVGFRPPPGFEKRPLQSASERGTTVKETIPRGDETYSQPDTSAPPFMQLLLGEPRLPQLNWRYSLGAQAVTGIVSDSSRIYVGCEDKTLVAIHTENPGIAWKTSFENSIEGNPQVCGKRVAINSIDRVAAFDTDCGRVLWQHQSEDSIQASSIMTNDSVFYLSAANRAICLDAATGDLLWRSAIGEVSLGSLCCGNRLLFVGEATGVRALGVDDGCEAWFSPTLDVVTSPISYNRTRILFGCRDRRVYCLDSASGQLRWTLKMKGETRCAPLITQGGLAYFVSQDLFLYCVNAEDGALIWRFFLGSSPIESPSAGGDSIYVGTKDALIYSLDSTSGRLNWKHDLGGAELKFSPLIEGRYLYVATVSAQLIRFQLPQPA